ncbi:MAG: ATP-binding protein [Methanobacteriota archaeon]
MLSLTIPTELQSPPFLFVGAVAIFLGGWLFSRHFELYDFAVGLPLGINVKVRRRTRVSPGSPSKEAYTPRPERRPAPTTPRGAARPALDTPEPPVSTARPPASSGISPVPTYVRRGSIEQAVRSHIKERRLAAIVGVTGPGGQGKTELAKGAVRDLANEFTEGAKWITAGPKSAPQLLADIANACGLGPLPSDSLEAGARALRAGLDGRDVLLVIDDIREANAGLLSPVASPTPPCAMLVTSRLRQPSAAIPTDAVHELDQMTPEEAINLLRRTLPSGFVERERDAAIDLVKTCRHNPLAIDIAARLVKAVPGDSPVRAVETRIHGRLGTLKAGSDPRLNLFGVVSVSVDELSKPDRERFVRLAAFSEDGVGLSFTAEAAACVLREREDDMRGFLNRLSDMSLLKPAPAEVEAFRFHDLVDEFAVDALRASGEEQTVRARHADCVLEFFSTHNLVTPDDAPFAALAKDNLRAAIRRAISAGDSERAGRLATVPGNWLTVWGLYTEWENWLSSCVTNPPLSAATAAQIFFRLGKVQQFKDDTDAALASYNQALDLYKKVGDRLGEANTLHGIGEAQQLKGQAGAALASYTQALDLYKKIGDRVGEANTLSSLGCLEVQRGNVVEAERLVRQAAALNRSGGNKYNEAVYWGNFAISLVQHGHASTAARCAATAENLYRQLGHPSADKMRRLIEKTKRSR